jgi:2,3,4,5-tetrahydropyridine-2,6-dicarboxylate N-succinyltransferase
MVSLQKKIFFLFVLGVLMMKMLKIRPIRDGRPGGPHLELKERIEAAFSGDEKDPAEIRKAFDALMAGLNAGTVRAAEKKDGVWTVNSWVKKGILLGFRIGVLADRSIGGSWPFFDKDTFPLKRIGIADGARIVPGGSAIRDGAYLGKGVTCMPPMYVNVGAYVDDGTMIDSHALIGSCAQVGKRVHVSAGTQIGGVLEPVGSLPVIIEDDVLIGGNCGIYEGTVVSTGAVIGAGTILTGGTPVLDLVHDTILSRSAEAPIMIPAGAVVVPGSRPVSDPEGRRKGVSIYAPIIVKYRDEKTGKSARLEDLLR